MPWEVKSVHPPVFGHGITTHDHYPPLCIQVFEVLFVFRYDFRKAVPKVRMPKDAHIVKQYRLPILFPQAKAQTPGIDEKLQESGLLKVHFRPI